MHLKLLHPPPFSKGERVRHLLKLEHSSTLNDVVVSIYYHLHFQNLLHAPLSGMGAGATILNAPISILR